MRNNREVVIESVKLDGRSIYYASNELKNDKEIAF